LEKEYGTHKARETKGDLYLTEDTVQGNVLTSRTEWTEWGEE